jgi:hypothetical protein
MIIRFNIQAQDWGRRKEYGCIFRDFCTTAKFLVFTVMNFLTSQPRTQYEFCTINVCAEYSNSLAQTGHWFKCNSERELRNVISLIFLTGLKDTVVLLLLLAISCY